jgi:hypothetical protein
MLLAVPALVALGITLVNLPTWPRGRRCADQGARVSVLIPARDEEATIESAVHAALENDPPVHEVVVCDDNSTDDTPAILDRLRAAHPRLRVVSAPPLPAGWVGKPHACQVLSEHATGDVLVFVDADTMLAREGIVRVLDLFSRYRADAVSALPRQVMGSFAERLLLPLLSLTYTSWLPLFLVWWSRNPRFLAANGQVLALSREALDAVGGFAAVRAEVVDDVALCRHAKKAGLRVVFADGRDLASCRMYGSAAEIWRGFSKNICEGLGGSALAVLAVLGLYLSAFVVPYLALLAALGGASSLLLPGIAGVGANLTLRGALAIRFGHSVGSVLLHPLAVVVLAAIAVNSIWWTRGDAIRWRGRVYPGRPRRGAV